MLSHSYIVKVSASGLHVEMYKLLIAVNAILNKQLNRGINGGEKPGDKWVEGNLFAPKNVISPELKAGQEFYLNVLNYKNLQSIRKLQERANEMEEQKK